ncbi:MAG: PIG-L family deacetylase [Chloroflexota bacterium]
MKYLFLSPHYDDAVYSCGGSIAELKSQGQSVIVVTVCAGYPPTNELSYFAETLHQRWGLDDHKAVAQMIDMRRQEDQSALQILGGDSKYLEIPDCIYRRGGDQNRWLYPREDSLFGPLSGSEDNLISDIARSLINLTEQLSSDPFEIEVVAPLAIGNHVDHQLVRYAAERAFGSETLTYYQDFPYIRERDQIITYENSADWRSEIRYLSENSINKKVKAIAAYESQISTFWRSKDDLAQEVRQFTRGWGNGELFWSFNPSFPSFAFG